MQWRAIGQLTTAMAIFGSIGFFTKQTGIPAVELVFVRCIFATLFLSGLWLMTGGARTEQWQRKQVFLTMLCGVFLVLNWVFLFKAFEEMSISVAISIYNLAPIFVLLLGVIFLAEKLTVQAIMATSLCFFGTVLIVGTAQFTTWQALFNSGFVWALLSAIFYALTMFTSKNIHGLSSYALTFIQTSIGIVMLLPFCDFGVFHGLTGSNWLYILGTGILHTGFVYYLFFNSIRALPSILVAVLVFVDPLVAILLDIIILSFQPSLLQISGIIIVFASIVYIIFLPKKRAIQP